MWQIKSGALYVANWGDAQPMQWAKAARGSEVLTNI